jgi:hypothetical protein
MLIVGFTKMPTKTCAFCFLYNLTSSFAFPLFSKMLLFACYVSTSSLLRHLALAKCCYWPEIISDLLAIVVHGAFSFSFEFIKCSDRA